MTQARRMAAASAVLTLLAIQGIQPASAAQETPAASIRRELAAPFSYFRAPTDQLGFENSPKAIVVTYDGAFVSSHGQLSFYAGAPTSMRPVKQRVKTLLDGYLPVIRFGFDRDGLRYDFEAFAAPPGLDPRANLVTFIQCTVRNPGARPRRAALGANFGRIASTINVDHDYDWFMGQRQALDHALRTQRGDWHTRLFMDEAAFAAGSANVSFEDGRMVQGGHLVFVGPTDDAKAGMPGVTSADKGAALEYEFLLRPGGSRVFRFKMPAVPTLLSKSAAVASIVEAGYDDYRAKTIAFWKAEVAKADHFSVADPKVMNTFRTSLVNDLVAREESESGRVYQRVNRIHYNYFWVRDGSYFVRVYDMVGRPDLARATLDAFLVWQDGKPIGFFKPGAPQPPDARLSVQDDYWGQVLWAFGAHIRTTGDRALLAEIYPLLGPHVDEFVEKCATDPRGLWPAAGPYDNEAITGHYTGHSFWALLGLKYAVYLARAMNRPDDAARWQKIHDDYEANFLKQLRALAAQSGGYIPPGMDSVTAGNDWANASGGLYPFEVLTKDDPLARATLAIVRDNNYQEGIMTYGGNAWVAREQKQAGSTKPHGTLHHYETFYITEGNTMLGEQEKVIEDLYAILAHTSSTNAGFEFGIPAWSTRDPRGNFTPHGWFAARFMEQIRNLLVREEGTAVHITSALAPQWVEAGRQVKVSDAPTFFGRVSYTLACRRDGATLSLSNHWKDGAGPSAVVFHLPWFVTPVSATVDGKPARVAHGAIELPPGAHNVQVRWRRPASEPNLSYAEAVRLFLEKYYRKPAGADYEFLFPRR
ncbi:MAG TPA: hypothetical protein VFX12_08370 [Vicinamibacterales bacterium]|nr:hypothetical protein [Vicinamibacterales bacterium]